MATLINICGTSRSGSTMLDLMLGNAPNAFSCGEVSAWFRPYRKHHFRLDCPCGQDPCPVWSELKDLPMSEFHAQAAARLGVDYIVDSSKDLCWLIDAQRWAIDEGMLVFNLLIWKHPIDLAYSHWKRGRSPANWRSEFVKYHQRLFQLNPALCSVNQDDLVRDPQTILAQICTLVGMEYFEGKERFWEKTHHHLFGSNGARRQVESGESRLKPRGDFSPEFADSLATLERQIENDDEVQQILHKISSLDVMRGDGQADLSVHVAPAPPYPVWCYLMRMQTAVQRYFPRTYP